MVKAISRDAIQKLPRCQASKHQKEYVFKCLRFTVEKAWGFWPEDQKKALSDSVKQMAMGLLEQKWVLVAAGGAVLSAALFIDSMGRTTDLGSLKRGVAGCLVGFKEREAAGAVSHCLEVLHVEIPATVAHAGKVSKVDGVCHVLGRLVHELEAHLDTARWEDEHATMFIGLQTAFCAWYEATLLQQELRSLEAVKDPKAVLKNHVGTIERLARKYIEHRRNRLTFIGIFGNSGFMEDRFADVRVDTTFDLANYYLGLVAADAMAFPVALKLAITPQ